MRIKIIGVMLSLTFIMSILSGCGAKESDSSDSENLRRSEAESNFVEKAVLQTVRGIIVQHQWPSLEIEVNALGMPIMSGTASIMTITVYGDHNYYRVDEEYEYDGEGRILRYIDYDPYSIFGGRWEYEYDAVGNLTEEICYELEDGGVRYWIEYRDANDESDGEGLRIGSKYEGGGNLVSEIVYNSEGVLIKIIAYREEGTVRRVYEYDGAGNELSDIQYDEQGNIVTRREFEYDAAGNQTLMADYDADGNIEVSESYQIIHHYWPTENEYDAAGNRIKSEDYDYAGNVEFVTEYTYDEAGNMLQEIYNGYVEYEYEYDSAGNMIKKIEVPDVQWKEYEYDSENRLIKLTEYTHGTVYHWYEYEYRQIGTEESY